MKVPYLDLKAQHDSIKNEINAAIQKTMDNSSFILGPEVEALEREFAEFCESKYAVAVNSGTAALHLALMSLGIGKEDEVITAPNSFFATAEAISHCGATPVFCDINEENYNLDWRKLEEKITKKTKAIIPVHLYGNPCDMDKINEIARKHNLRVIEDACQAHGAEFFGKRVGSLSDISAFSFYPGKNLGACGEGGIIVTNNFELAEKCRLYRAHGENPKNTHKVVGYNYRLEGLQGAILRVKLRYLSSWNEQRRKNAEIYTCLLKDVVITPKIQTQNKPVFHIYAIRHRNRDKLRDFLQSKGISTGVHYEKPIHLQEAYSFLGYGESDFPVAEKITKEILSLPMYPEMTVEQIKYVCDAIKEFELISR
ncbi:MAG: DegT/DnrJ/EryC1/StrS family aminotransferase [Nanoarchaeota archaeon]